MLGNLISGLFGALLGALVSAVIALHIFDRQLQIDNMRLALKEYASLKSIRPNSLNPQIEGEYEKIIGAHVAAELINKLSGSKAGNSARKVYWSLDCLYRFRNDEPSGDNDCEKKLKVSYNYTDLSNYYTQESDKLLELIAK